jgi:hypothetical protein
MRSHLVPADCLGYDFEFKEIAELTGKFAKKIFSIRISNLQPIAFLPRLTGENRRVSRWNMTARLPAWTRQGSEWCTEMDMLKRMRTGRPMGRKPSQF